MQRITDSHSLLFALSVFVILLVMWILHCIVCLHNGFMVVSKAVLTEDISIHCSLSFATDAADVVVGMEQSSVTFTEGYTRSVCVELQSLPAGGTEREVSVVISTTDLSAGLLSSGLV